MGQWVGKHYNIIYTLVQGFCHTNFTLLSALCYTNVNKETQLNFLSKCCNIKVVQISDFSSDVVVTTSDGRLNLLPLKIFSQGLWILSFAQWMVKITVTRGAFSVFLLLCTTTLFFQCLQFVLDSSYLSTPGHLSTTTNNAWFVRITCRFRRVLCCFFQVLLTCQTNNQRAPTS